MQRCSERAFAMCPYRHECGTIHEATFSDNSDCAEFNRKVENMPMTNADIIRARNDHELADMLSSLICDVNEGVEYSDNPNRWLEWLERPAEVNHES